MTALPGDPDPANLLARMIRVDHAGEYGATRIYAGQLAVLGRSDVAPLLRQMLAQEQMHLAAFNDIVANRRVRPTALLPLWHAAGFALGVVTAALGPRAAMACTVAVEETIDEHYASQEASLPSEESDLLTTIATFRAEELDHRDIGLANGAEQTPFYRTLTAVIKLGCRAAIAVSERV